MFWIEIKNYYKIDWKRMPSKEQYFRSPCTILIVSDHRKSMNKIKSSYCRGIDGVGALGSKGRGRHQSRGGIHFKKRSHLWRAVKLGMF